MPSSSYKYNLYMSFNDNDISFVKKLYNKLPSTINIFIEDNKNLNNWNSFYNSLLNSQYNIFIYSENSIIDNEKLELIYKVWVELLKRKDNTILLNTSNRNVPPLFKTFYYIENISNDIDDIAKEIHDIFFMKTLVASKLIIKKEKIELDKIEKSLFYKLKFDTFLSKKQYSDKYYIKNSYDEHIKLLFDTQSKDYYLDYWGLKSINLLSPVLFEKLYTKTSNYIYSKLIKNKILEIPIKKSDKEIKYIKSLKQTIWGLEILLLSESNLDFIIKFTEEFILNSKLYNNKSDWKEFIYNENTSSLLTAVYLFSFLSKMKKYININESILLETEKFIIDNFKTNKWEFSNLHWFISTTDILINCFDFFTDKIEVNNIAEKLLTKLDNGFFNTEIEYLSLDYYIEPYSLYSRLIYILFLIKGDNIDIEYKKNIINNLKNNYNHITDTSNFDIFIITSILIHLKK